MTKEEALQLLALTDNATESEIENKFAELHNDFQMRLTNAPTPNLKKLYQGNIQEIEQAKEVLLNNGQNQNVLPSSEPTFIAKSTSKQKSNPSHDFSTPSPSKELKQIKKVGTNKSKIILFASLFVISAGFAIFFIIKSIELDGNLANNEESVLNVNKQLDSLNAELAIYKSNFSNGKCKIKNNGNKEIYVTVFNAIYMDSNGKLQKYEGLLNEKLKGGASIEPMEIIGTQVVWDGSVIFYTCEFYTTGGTGYIYSGSFVEDAKNGIILWNFDQF